MEIARAFAFDILLCQKSGFDEQGFDCIPQFTIIMCDIFKKMPDQVPYGVQMLLAILSALSTIAAMKYCATVEAIDMRFTGLPGQCVLFSGKIKILI